jgi:hypothetical protein
MIHAVTITQYTSGAGNPSGAPELIPLFCAVRVAQSLVSCIVL